MTNDSLSAGRVIERLRDWLASRIRWTQRQQMIGPGAAIKRARALKGLLRDRVQINAERPPFALDQNWSVLVSHPYQTGVSNSMIANINRQIAFTRVVDFHVSVVSQDRCNFRIANSKRAAGEDPAVTIRGGV